MQEAEAVKALEKLRLYKRRTDLESERLFTEGKQLQAKSSAYQDAIDLLEKELKPCAAPNSTT